MPKPMMMATMRQSLNDIEAAVDHLLMAYEIVPSEDVVYSMTMMLAPSGDIAGARKFLDRAARDEPSNPIKAMRWRRLIDWLYDYVDSVETEMTEAR